MREEGGKEIRWRHAKIKDHNRERKNPAKRVPKGDEKGESGLSPLVTSC